MKLRYHSLARREVLEATAYYAAIRPELGAEFAAELDSAIQMILKNPQAFEQVRPGTRRFMLKRFPYGVYYRTPDSETVRITVLRHHSRRPNLGMRRR